LVGTPIRVEFKENTNPFAGRRSLLTPRQERKRKVMLREHRKG